MGEIADDHIDRMMFPRYGGFYEDYSGNYASQYRPPPNRTATVEAFPILAEDKMKEAPIEKYLRDEVKKLGGEHRKVVYQGRTGSPDDWCFFPGGNLLIVECKRPGKKPTAQQMDEIEWLCKKGFNATWVDSFEAIDRALDPFRYLEFL